MLVPLPAVLRRRDAVDALLAGDRGMEAARAPYHQAGTLWRLWSMVGHTMVASVDPELVRLRAEIADLRAGLEARTQENAQLLQMITDVISTLKLDQVLRHIVDHLVAALGCHGAFIYLWEPARQRLVLRGASVQYRHLIGRIELGRGEGLVGWSALMGKPAMLRERAMEDPRFRYFPELQEELFQAILTVPMTGVDGSVVAVISLHTIAPQEFTDEHVRLVAAVAPILGGAIETSELYENTARKLAVLSTLSGLAQTARSGPLLDDVLRTLAETAVKVAASDLCLLIMAEPGLDRLTVCAYAPGGEASAATMHKDVLGRQPWEHLAGATSPAELGLQHLLPEGNASTQPGVHMVAPLVAAGEQLGLMICYRLAGTEAGRQYGEDDVAILNIIANQAAIALKNSQLADLLAERDVPARLFRDLTQGPEGGEDLVWRRAALLGCDLAWPHVPLVLDFAQEPPRADRRHAAYGFVATLAQRWLAEPYPGSLVHVDAGVLVLVRLPASGDLASLFATFDAFQQSAERKLRLRLVGGLGRTCRVLADYRRGFAEAREALRVARGARSGAGLLRFDALGAARYLSRIPRAGAGDEVQDRYQESLERVAGYDARKGTALLETLETYLAAGGNVARAAERLYVHRNTMVQRLEKLHDLLGLDPHDSDHWLALHIALKLLQRPRDRQLQGGPADVEG